MKKVTVLLALLTLISGCGSWANYSHSCRTYSRYHYRCIEDNEIAIAVVCDECQKYQIGDTIISPRSGHRVVITKVESL